MSNPWIRTFFIGRATAEILLEKLEDAVTDLLSEVGKAEADWRDGLREFTEEVLTRAEAEQAETLIDLSAEGYTSRGTASSKQVERNVDELRAEVARLRSELQRFRNQEAP
ncbi:DUF6825 family protein [Gloeobacter kilaueensis]|uniref:Thylakoid lumen protein n=1 Tax=Gloeobacter kilaueensis (strain ATCC BAA-2537 / CCAP 1431/1 / ULC 316 / JS1) TaxID=1183438 RepID=U5QFQ8_GLOK1|nr:hypothetical protein [Gloeobacter kilaueensis]AGY57713.1 hypothetical protein GKIL_1467 [Gloeobacter kilaueensis JS1]